MVWRTILDSLSVQSAAANADVTDWSGRQLTQSQATGKQLKWGKQANQAHTVIKRYEISIEW